MARGKLVDKVRNLIKVCEEAVPKRSRKRSCNSIDSPENSNENLVENLETNPDYLWLRINREPWAEVIEKWQKTYALRNLKKASGCVAGIFKEWPILEDLRSECLVCTNYIIFKGIPI